VGSLVQVPFHGRAVRGWVIGPATEPPARMLPVRKVVSPIRFFTPSSLELLRWVSERYVAPLASVIARASPPRVASEESTPPAVSVGPAAAGLGRGAEPGVVGAYRGGDALLRAVAGAGGAFVLRPAPEDEVAAAVELVRATLAAGRRALVLVPEASPIPATASAMREAFGDHVCLFLGGAARARFRSWLEVRAGRFPVVVGTRPAVFAPVDGLGLLYVSRESHAAHREDRSPYYHVRDVAIARARLEGAACVLSALCPSSEAASLELPEVTPASRRWPPVEVVRPGPEGRAPRLVQALRDAGRAFLYAPVPGAGLAQVCRACREPAACASCGGALRAEEGSVRCIVCEAPGRCRACGASSFGIRPGGEERVEQWASRVVGGAVRRARVPRLPREREVLVGGADDVRDLGPGGLELVGILDADLAERLPGLAARERSLATWFEAAGWARPAGRVIVQSARTGDPAVQALVRGNPARFHADEVRRRAAAGFPVGGAVFRVAGDATAVARVETLRPITLLVTGSSPRLVCLLALATEGVPAFGEAMRELAATGSVERVEAEPHL
jgi:primosomal protein N' (replication factor Y)